MRLGERSQHRQPARRRFARQQRRSLDTHRRGALPEVADILVARDRIVPAQEDVLPFLDLLLEFELELSRLASALDLRGQQLFVPCHAAMKRETEACPHRDHPDHRRRHHQHDPAPNAELHPP